MRDRLVAAFVSLTAVVLTLFVGVRAYTTAELVEAQETTSLARTAEAAATLLTHLETEGEPVTPAVLADLARPGEHLRYVPADGDPVTSAAEPASAAVEQLTVSRPVAGGGTVTLSRDPAVVDERVSDVLLPLVVLGIALVLLAGAAGVLAAARLSRPFRELAAAATMVGRGRFDVEVPHYGVPEAEAIGSALRRSARDLDALVRREREFAVSASHELRTPVTALRLEIEDVASWPQTPPDVAEELSRALAELDRLSATITTLLGGARGLRLGDAVEINLVPLVEDAVRPYRATSRRRPIDLDAPPVVAVRLPHEPIAQILDALVGNAVRHGAGTVTVSVAGRGEYAEVRVADEGLRPSGTATVRQPVPGRDGETVATAVRVAEALGGRLRLTEDRCTTFSLVLPTSNGRST